MTGSFPIISALLIVALVAGIIIAGRRQDGLADVDVSPSQIIIRPKGVLKIFSFRREITIATSQVVRASLYSARAEGGADLEVGPSKQLRRGLRFRLAGTYLPGGVRAGLHRDGDGKSFWLTGQGSNIMRLNLSGNFYDYVVVDVADPAGKVRLINSYIGQTYC